MVTEGLFALDGAPGEEWFLWSALRVLREARDARFATASRHLTLEQKNALVPLVLAAQMKLLAKDGAPIATVEEARSRFLRELKEICTNPPDTAQPLEKVFGVSLSDTLMKALRHPEWRIRSYAYFHLFFEPAVQYARSMVYKAHIHKVGRHWVNDWGREVAVQLGLRMRKDFIHPTGYPRYIQRLLVDVIFRTVVSASELEEGIELTGPASAEPEENRLAVVLLEESIRDAALSERDLDILLTLGEVTEHTRKAFKLTEQLAARHGKKPDYIRVIFQRTRRKVLRSFIQRVRRLPEKQRQRIRRDVKL